MSEIVFIHSLPSTSDAAGVLFDVCSLPPESSVRLKIFARNSRGKSDYVWLRAQTLRAADPLIEDQGFLGANHLPDHQRLYSLFRRPLLLFFLTASAAVILTVMSLAVLLYRQLRSRSSLTASSVSCHFNSGSQIASRTSSECLNDSREALKRSSGSCDGNKSSSWNEEFCDQQLLSSRDQPANPYPGRNGVANGPPDIIPCFPFAAPLDEEATTSFPLDDKKSSGERGTRNFAAIRSFFPQLTSALLTLHPVNLTSSCARVVR